MGDLRIDQDAMVFSIAFAPTDQDIPMPPWAKQLPTLGAADSGSTGQTRSVDPDGSGRDSAARVRCHR